MTQPETHTNDVRPLREIWTPPVVTKTVVDSAIGIATAMVAVSFAKHFFTLTNRTVGDLAWLGMNKKFSKN